MHIYSRISMALRAVKAIHLHIYFSICLASKASSAFLIIARQTQTTEIKLKFSPIQM